MRAGHWSESCVTELYFDGLVNSILRCAAVHLYFSITYNRVSPLTSRALLST